MTHTKLCTGASLSTTPGMLSGNFCFRGIVAEQSCERNLSVGLLSRCNCSRGNNYGTHSINWHVRQIDPYPSDGRVFRCYRLLMSELTQVAARRHFVESMRFSTNNESEAGIGRTIIRYGFLHVEDGRRHFWLEIRSIPQIPSQSVTGYHVKWIKISGIPVLVRQRPYT